MKKFNLLENNWDFLFVLDACRYDIFKEINFLGGKLKKRISASCTLEFIDKHIKNKNLNDTICITANPYFSKLKNFYRIINVWDWGWNENLGTVPPHIVTETIIINKKRFPKKKIYAHYMQPHHPFIGKTKIKEIGFNIVISQYKKNIKKRDGITVYEQLKQGIITHKQIMQAYKDNLELVLNSLKPLLKLKGKKIITSDHGDCFGEHDIYAHPYGVKVPELIKVPWFTIKS